MKHYDVSYAGEPFDYKGSGFGTPNLPDRGEGHVDQILDLYRAVIAKDEAALKNADVAQVRDGYYIRLQNTADYDFALKSIDSTKIGHIVSVHDTETPEGGVVTSAILFLKKEEKDWLEKKVETYKGNKRTKNNERLNKPLLESIDKVDSVQVEDLWSGKGHIPGEVREWVELWFMENEAVPVMDKLDELGITHNERSLKFPERVVVIACVNKKDLERIFYASNSLVRISEVPTLAGFITDEPGMVQEEWKDMIMGVFQFDHINNNKYLCLLDSGVVKDHPMLLPVLANEDHFVVNPAWGINDVKRHGTLMAGIATYGDLTDVIANAGGIEPRYRLCSVKILPNDGKSLKDFWADYTKQAVALAEIGNGQMPEILAYCMAVSEIDGNTNGTPTSWSGSLDQICYGEDGLRRLFIQCAGNVDEERDWVRYPDSNRSLGIVNPGQAWNALTVGAYTEKCVAFDAIGNQKDVVAQKGGLSPYSTTSAFWGPQTPIKPEVVMEGGNRTKGPAGTDRHNDLELLTTGTAPFIDRHFAWFNATSAATAMASRYAAIVAAENPNYWPETIRGLFVHTAQWTEQMMADFPDMDERLRICGYGVPNLEKMLESRKNGVTFIAQNSIQPYKKGEKNNSFNKMHIYELPWPKNALLDLGEQDVRLTITLSYYIEPGPTDNYVASFKKYNYASAGLRFELSNVNEKLQAFKHRIQREYDEDEVIVENDTQRWGIGIRKRTKGSIHKDWVEMSAADLATCNKIAVFPVSGWWYNRKNLDKVESNMRYSLIVSLETEGQQVDFSVEIENAIAIANGVSIEI